MPQFSLSESDRRFVSDFAAGKVSPPHFDHRSHVRLAYAYLAQGDPDTAANGMRQALLGFLRHHNVDASKYHETLTRAWILAVWHFMQRSSGAESADAFISANTMLLDSKIMLTHYSAELLFSDHARNQFVEPNLEALPGLDQ